MKTKTICLALITLWSVAHIHAQISAATPISQRAIITLKVPGFTDFLVAPELEEARQFGSTLHHHPP